MITKRELTQDNIRAFGIAEAAKILKRQRVPFSIAYWLIFGQAPRKLQNPPPVYVKLFARVTGRALRHI
jgi:hypothetical protein